MKRKSEGIIRKFMMLCLISLGLNGISFSQITLIDPQTKDTLTCFTDLQMNGIQLAVIERDEYRDIMNERGVQVNSLNQTIFEEKQKTKRAEEKLSVCRKDNKELIGQRSTWGAKYKLAEDKIDSQKTTIRILGGTLVVVVVVPVVVAIVRETRR